MPRCPLGRRGTVYSLRVGTETSFRAPSPAEALGKGQIGVKWKSVFEAAKPHALLSPLSSQTAGSHPHPWSGDWEDRPAKEKRPMDTDIWESSRGRKGSLLPCHATKQLTKLQAPPVHAQLPNGSSVLPGWLGQGSGTNKETINLEKMRKCKKNYN